MVLVERPLFGGNISCNIPESWIDVSNIRQVPDHQECWLDEATNGMFVVEILELQSEVADAKAAKHFFDDLAEANNAAPNSVLHYSDQPQDIVQINNLPESAVLCFGAGYQHVALGRDSDHFGNPRTQEILWVLVELCLIRLPSVETDLLITLSTPNEPNPQEGTLQHQATNDFQQALTSFQIRDWRLFG